MTTLKTTNENYCGTIVKIDGFVEVGLKNLVSAPIMGFNALVTRNYQPGLYVLFTAECQLSEDFCKSNNLYDKPEMNSDPTIKGYISHKRRVRAVKLGGHMSSALLMRLECLSKYVDISTLEEGDTFNEIDGVEIVTKYKIQRQYSNGNGKSKKKIFKPRDRFNSKLIPEHFDTAHWLKNSRRFSPETNLLVSQKLEGTSVRLCNQQIATYPKLVSKFLYWAGQKGYGNYKAINWIDRFFRKMEWQPIAGSRRVVKLRDLDLQGYYKEDIYNEALDKICHIIPKSWVIYGELIGWAGEKPIQPKYTYNVPKGEHHLYVYRISIVNLDGVAVDLSFAQMEKWCVENGIRVCPLMWAGPLSHFNHSAFMDIKFYEKGYSECVPLSPESPCDEGIVIRIEQDLAPEFFKCKSPLYLGYETEMLDSGIVSTEEEESDDRLDL